MALVVGDQAVQGVEVGLEKKLILAHFCTGIQCAAAHVFHEEVSDGPVLLLPGADGDVPDLVAAEERQAVVADESLKKHFFYLIRSGKSLGHNLNFVNLALPDDEGSVSQVRVLQQKSLRGLPPALEVAVEPLLGEVQLGLRG